MARDVEGGARLPRISPLGRFRILDLARRVHCAGAEEHIDLAERLVDGGNHLEPATTRLNVIPGPDKRAGEQPTPREPAVITRSLAQPRRMDRPCLALQDHPVD